MQQELLSLADPPRTHSFWQFSVLQKTKKLQYKICCQPLSPYSISVNILGFQQAFNVKRHLKFNVIQWVFPKSKFRVLCKVWLEHNISVFNTHSPMSNCYTQSTSCASATPFTQTPCGITITITEYFKGQKSNRKLLFQLVLFVISTV